MKIKHKTAVNEGVSDKAGQWLDSILSQVILKSKSKISKFIITFDAILNYELTTTASVAILIFSPWAVAVVTDRSASTTLGDVAASGLVTSLKASFWRKRWCCNVFVVGIILLKM